jgi:hypothetical protein
MNFATFAEKSTMVLRVLQLALAAGVLCAGTASAEVARSWMSYDGTAVDADDGRVLYRESHFVALEGERVAERLVLYRCADGTPFARKRVAPLFDSPWLPEFDMTDARLGYREGLAANGESVQVFVQEAGEKSVERETLAEVPPDLVGDAGFDSFVRDNWEKLVAGETLRFNFLVPSRLGYLAFKVRQIGEERIGDRPVRVFRLALGGLIGLIVSGIDVAYDAESRILMRFEGLSNIRDIDGENHVARIDFPADARRDEPGPAALEAARTVTLATACAM